MNLLKVFKSLKRVPKVLVSEVWDDVNNKPLAESLDNKPVEEEVDKDETNDIVTIYFEGNIGIVGVNQEIKDSISALFDTASEMIPENAIHYIKNHVVLSDIDGVFVTTPAQVIYDDNDTAYNIYFISSDNGDASIVNIVLEYDVIYCKMDNFAFMPSIKSNSFQHRKID